MSHSEPLSSLMFGFKKASFLKPSSTLTSSFRGYLPSLPWKIKRWCAIAQSCKWYQPKLWILIFEDWTFIKLSKKRKQFVLPLLSSTNVEQRPLVPLCGFCPPGTGEICRRPTDQREVMWRGVKTIEEGERLPPQRDGRGFHLPFFPCASNDSLTFL